MQNSSDHLIINLSRGATAIGAGTTVASGLSLYELGIWAGFAVGVIGVASQYYWSWRREKREALATKQLMRYRKRAFEALGADKWLVLGDITDDDTDKNP